MRTAASPPSSAVIWRPDRARQVRWWQASAGRAGCHARAPCPPRSGTARAEGRQGPVHAPLTRGACLLHVRRERELRALILKARTAAHPIAVAGQAGGVAGYAGLTTRIE
jgi:hypothetical protein